MLSMHNMHLSGTGDGFAVLGQIVAIWRRNFRRPPGGAAGQNGPEAARGLPAGQGAGDSISCGVIVKPGIVDGVVFDGNIRSR